MKKGSCCSLAVLIIGILLIVVGLVVQFAVVPLVFDDSLEIKEGSLQYRNWYKPTVPVYMQWYVFNLTNVENFTANLEKAKFTQLGPYTYRENRWKANVTWNSNASVTYKNLRWWTFDAENSVGSEDDLIYSINLPLVTVAESLSHESAIIKEAFQLLANHYGEELCKQYKMKDLIWGYHDPMMTAAMAMLPDWFYTDFVGVFAGKNYTDDGVWTVNTGEKDINRVGQTEAYNGSLYLDFWSTDYANMVNGSDGTVGTPHLDKVKDSSVYFFVPDICRSLYAVYSAEEKTSKDITLYRYTSTAEELQGPEKNPDNAGFCTPLGNCILGDGMMNLSTCQLLDHFNVPVVASLPHFLFADQKYLDMVEGLHPVENEHRTDVCIEPITGLVMRIAKRLQINMYLKPVQYLPVLRNVEEMVFPVAWLNESMHVDDKNQDLYLSTMELMTAAIDTSYVLYGIGALMVVIGALCLLYLYLKGRSGTASEREPLLGKPATSTDPDEPAGPTAPPAATLTDSEDDAAASHSD